MLLRRLLDYSISVNVIFQLVFPCQNFDETELLKISVSGYCIAAYLKSVYVNYNN